jgi:hypothetical protein
MFWIKQTYTLDISIVSLLLETRRFGASYALLVKWSMKLTLLCPLHGNMD